MARMIPSRFDESTSSAAERLLYYRLQNHLENDWTVIHSLPWLNEKRIQIQQGECDFLLLHPKHGMLVLEVKSGTPHYNGSSGKWSYDDGKPITDPFYQARKSMHFLNDHLRERSATWFNADLPHGYAVAFPDARSVTGNLRPDIGMDLLILESDLEQFQRTVINLLKRFAQPCLQPNPAVIESALEILQPTFHLVPSLAPTIELAHKELVRLTAEQTHYLEGMAGNRRLLVRGGAGTGKTLLIVARAQKLAAEGKKVLVLCYNKPLAASLRNQLAGCSDNVTASTFHDFCMEVANHSEADLPDPGANDFWNVLLPEAAFEATADYPHQFDAIFIDEGQDFLADWWVMIEELLADDQKSVFHVFGDQQQNLYGREAAFPFTQPEYVLRRNCRNTGPVASFARNAVGLGDDDSLALLPHGPRPVIHQVNDTKEERDAVRRVLHQLVQEQGVDARRIVILGCHRLEKSSFAEACKLGNLTVRDADESEATNSIRYCTIHKFKGLEADCVLLTGMGAPSSFFTPEHMQRFRYVGGSRARVILHVFEW